MDVTVENSNISRGISNNQLAWLLPPRSKNKHFDGISNNQSAWLLSPWSNIHFDGISNNQSAWLLSPWSKNMHFDSISNNQSAWLLSPWSKNLHFEHVLLRIPNISDTQSSTVPRRPLLPSCMANPANVSKSLIAPASVERGEFQGCSKDPNLLWINSPPTTFISNRSSSVPADVKKERNYEVN